MTVSELLRFVKTLMMSDERDRASLSPSRPGTYLNIILGNVNVTLHDQDSRFKYKEEYEKFKLVVSVIIVVLTVISLCIRYR